MENNNANFEEEINKRKAEKGIENMELIYQQLLDNEQEEENENEEDEINKDSYNRKKMNIH